MIDLSRRFLLLVAPSFAIVFLPAFARADIHGFGDFSGFKITPNDPQALPAITILPGIHSAIDLTGPAGGEARSIFDMTPQPTSHFTASFIYQDKDTAHAQHSAGFAFVLQSIGGGFDAVGGTQNHLGYNGGNFGSSAAVEFTLLKPLATGVFTNGGVGTGPNLIDPVDLVSGHPIKVNIEYNGAILSETVTDTITELSSPTFSYPLQLPFATAFVGLTASTDGADDQSFSDFQYSTPEPSSLVLAAIGVAGMLVCAYRRRRA